MYMMMAVMFTCIFFDLDPATSFPLRQASYELAQQFGQIVEANVKLVSATGFISSVIDGLRNNHSPLADYGIHMIRSLLDSGLGASEVTWSQVVPTSIAMVPNQAQVVRVSLPHRRFPKLS
jgi:linoleate 10R-lipoxygenase